ncbi:CHAT domain-containing protein [Suillus occidentalis]|nr:CHAT domain-containing protein [Suillus occidentalis]
MSGSSEMRCIKLEVIRGKNLIVPSLRIPAGIYVLINDDSQRRWKSAIGVLSSDRSVEWGDTVSPALSVEIKASYESDRMLGSGEVIGKVRMSWDELLDHGDEPFDLSFPSVYGVHPSLTLKAAVVQALDDQNGALPDSLVDCEITRCIDAGHAQFAEYVLVLDQCPASHPDHAAALTNLAWTCILGYIRNHLQDIDTTISLFHDALVLHPQCHPDRPLSIYNLAVALGWRHNKKSTAVDIREAAQLYHELLPLCPEGTYLRSIVVGPNGVDYVIGSCNNLPKDTSDEGIHLRRIVLKLCPLGHQLRLKALDRFSNALKPRFKRHGNIDHLDEGIQSLREAVSLCLEGHPNRGTYLNNLAMVLNIRFDHQGKPDDLDEAISLYEEALRLCHVGHRYRDSSLSNLGPALVTRFDKRGDIDDITQAISLYREALTLRPPGNPHRFITLYNIALALNKRYDKLDVSEDLNEAIDRYRESLRLTRLDHPERHRTLHSLSSALSSRFTQTQKNEDVEEAIILCQEALASLPLLHPERFRSYTRLQQAYLSRFRVQHNLPDLSLAIENFRLASRHPTQGFPSRIKGAIDWARQAEVYQHESDLEAYQTCFELLNSHVMTRSSIIARLELMEQGRGQHWSLASRLKTPVEDLESANPKLAHDFLELSKRIFDVARSSATITDRAAADLAATEYTRLTRQWEAVVAEIRDLRAFSRFLLPPLYKDLQAAARHGPVIIFIASQYSCSAIVVPTSGEPHHISWFSRIASPGQYDTRTDLIVLLRIVWDEIMPPIVNVLENVLKLKRRSRIWLCPTAPFTSIPLHAANPFRKKADHSKEPCLEDLYVCSYTPTLSALVRSRQMTKRHITPSFVAIGQGQPGAGKGKALLAVDSELELVHSLVPATANRSTISGDAATRTGALQALKENTWVHLACLGKQLPTKSYNSHFVTRDEHLTLLDIMDRDIPHAEFAFLSACHTAVGDKETPDEVIHLAAGLQFSRFKSVVGTLWEVDDAVAKHVVEAFYKYMFHPKEAGVMDYTKAAWALNCATHAVKTKVPLEQRIIFIHIEAVLSQLTHADMRTNRSRSPCQSWRVAAWTYGPFVQMVQTCGWDEDNDTYLGSTIFGGGYPTGVPG